MRSLTVEISPGELIDKMTILELKIAKFRDEDKKRHVTREYDALRSVFQFHVPKNDHLAGLISELKSVNEQLWNIEDDLRKHERVQDFGFTFVTLARSVYRLNDERAEIKRKINLLLGSDLVEEKSYGVP